MLEKQVEQKLTRCVHALGGRCYKFVSPGNSGVPDRIVVLPGGRVVFVELKRCSGARLDPLQALQASRLRALGCEVAAVKSIAEVDAFCKAVNEGKAL
ncbi:MAG: VRR-NUC domain-containing protein [Ruthenibacterium sp.]